MAGAPGSGKTLLARALPGFLPEMSIEESLDVTRIYSVADQLPAGTPLIRHRPFRAPHHIIGHAGLVGGGNIPKPVKSRWHIAAFYFWTNSLYC
jgi:magnesium chelatase family protein